MSAFLALGIFLLSFRFVSQTGLTPSISLGLAGLSTFVVFPVVVSMLDGFAQSLGSNSILALVGIVAVAAAIGAAGYYFGRRSSSGNNDPFKPF